MRGTFASNLGLLSLLSLLFASSTPSCSSFGTTPSPDAGVLVGPDAGADAGAPTDAGADAVPLNLTATCPAANGATPLLCDDFDTWPLDSHWTSLDRGVTLDTMFSVSPMRSLLSRLNRDAPSCSYAVATQLFPDSSARGAHMSFAVRYEAATFTKSIVASLSVGTASANGCYALLALSGSTLDVDEQVQGGPSAGDSGHHGAVVVPPGRFARVDMILDYAMSRLVVTVDGQPSISDPLARSCPYLPGKVTAKLGLYCDSGADERLVRFDDLTVYAQ